MTRRGLRGGLRRVAADVAVSPPYNAGMELLAAGLDNAVVGFTQLFYEGNYFSFTYNVYALLAIFLTSLICSSMGTVVVGNRMAFFCDALAHCAWAGVALGLVLSILSNISDDFIRNYLTVIMVCFGIVIGLLITRVQEGTGLPSDTIIGVFFAGALGLGAVATKMIKNYKKFNIETFIFGDPLAVTPMQTLWFLTVVAACVMFFFFHYNQLVLASVNPSLAMSRRVPVRWCRYLFVVLLGVVVNLCLQVVGALLINGMLIVPAATAANLARNLRQLFWIALGISVVTGFLGQFLSWEVNQRYGLELTPAGTIVLLSCVGFALSMIPGRFGSLAFGRNPSTVG